MVRSQPRVYVVLECQTALRRSLLVAVVDQHERVMIHSCVVVRAARVNGEIPWHHAERHQRGRVGTLLKSWGEIAVRAGLIYSFEYSCITTFSLCIMQEEL